MSTGPGQLFINRPAAKENDGQWKSPVPPSNPAVRGLAIAYGAVAVSKSDFLQSLLWNNAGFGSLRNRPELDDAEPRYDPTVIKSTGGAPQAVADPQQYLAALAAEDWDAKKPVSNVFPSILDYHEAYKSGKVTPTAVAKALLPLIKRDVKDPHPHAIAFLQVREDLVLEAAEASTKRYQAGRPLGPLDGVPVAVKDEVDVTGYRKSYGSRLDFTRADDTTSFCVRKWQDAGAVLLGKTNMHELGCDTTNCNAHHGTPRNPNHPDYYTGGSSGGSAYTVAAGLSPLCEGNDGGGSIRIPANYCGLYGLKTSHGRVSKTPGINLARSTAVCGPLAANMVDLEIGYRIMAQPDADDRASSALFTPPGAAAVADGGRPKLLGVFPPWFERADPFVRERCQSVIDALVRTRGYRVVEITLPLLPEGQLAHALTILAELTAGLDPAETHLLTAPTKILTSVARKTTAVDLLQAQRLRNLLMGHLAHLFDAHPGLIIVTPTTPNAGWRIEKGDLTYGFTDGNQQIRNMEYVWLANFTGNPAISVPCGYADPPSRKGSKEEKGKIPVGFMGMGDWCSEDELIAFGYDCERYLADARFKPVNWTDVLQLATAEGK